MLPTDTDSKAAAGGLFSIRAGQDERIPYQVSIHQVKDGVNRQVDRVTF